MAEDARFIYRLFLIILIGSAATKHVQQVKIRRLPHDVTIWYYCYIVILLVLQYTVS